MSVTLTCGKDCAGSVDISKPLTAAPIGHWQVLDIPLACFAGEGTDLSAIDQPFALVSAGQLGLTLSEVKLVPAPGEIDCGRKPS